MQGSGSGSGFTFSAEPNQGYGQRHCQPLLQRPHRKRSHTRSHLPSLHRSRFFGFFGGGVSEPKPKANLNLMQKPARARPRAQDPHVQKSTWILDPQRIHSADEDKSELGLRGGKGQNLILYLPLVCDRGGGAKYVRRAWLSADINAGRAVHPVLGAPAGAGWWKYASKGQRASARAYPHAVRFG